MSRLQFPTGQVSTSVPCRDLLETNLCRDINFMSRPHILPPMSRHQIHVATPFMPIVGFPSRNAKLQVATSHMATHVATSKMMSQHQLSSAPFLLRRDAIFPCRDLPCCHPCRDLKHDIATSNQLLFKLLTLSQPLHVTTSKQGRDLLLEIGSSHSSFCLAKKKKKKKFQILQ